MAAKTSTVTLIVEDDTLHTSSFASPHTSFSLERYLAAPAAVVILILIVYTRLCHPASIRRTILAAAPQRGPDLLARRFSTIWVSKRRRGLATRRFFVADVKKATGFIGRGYVDLRKTRRPTSECAFKPRFLGSLVDNEGRPFSAAFHVRGS